MQITYPQTPTQDGQGCCTIRHIFAFRWNFVHALKTNHKKLQFIQTAQTDDILINL